MKTKQVWSLAVMLVILGLVGGSFGCAKPSVTPAPTSSQAQVPTPTPVPAPSPAPTAKTTTPPVPTTSIPAPAPKPTLPKEIILTSYDLGSSGYIQTAALAEGLAKKFGIKVRVLPAATSIGRLSSVRNGTALAGFIGDDAFFASKGIEEFCTYDWGPQDLRVVGATLLTVGSATPADAGIKKASDLKGKRVAWIPGAATTNIKNEAYLAFGNLTWKDVVKVEIPSYAASLTALVQGKIDMTNTDPGAAGAYDLASSPRGLQWLEMPPADKEGWARLQKVAPFMAPFKALAGAGIKTGETKDLVASRYNLIVYTNANEEIVYQFMKAVDEAFPEYKDIHVSMKYWTLDIMSGTPTHAPFHKGAIRYFKERGVWTAEKEAWNNAQIDLFDRLQKAWVTVRNEASEKKVKEADLRTYWETRRKELVGQ